MNPLRDFFDSRPSTEPGIWKWLHYFDVYHRHLRDFRYHQVTMLEIGVYGGGSLDMWHAYFNNPTFRDVDGSPSVIHGVDINPDCKRFRAPEVHVHIGNQGDPAFWGPLLEHFKFDIVVDDGSHAGDDQLTSFHSIYPHLNPGGVYIVEDVEPNRFYGEVGVILNALQPHDKFSRDETDDERSLVIPAKGCQKNVAAVHIYPMMVVIEKPLAPVTEFVASRKGLLP